MRRGIIRYGLAIAALLTASSVAAIPDAAWTDSAKRSVMLGFSGGSGQPPRAGSRTAADMAGAFKKLCWDTALDDVAIAKAAQAIGWGFNFEEVQVPNGRNKPPVDLVGWRADDAVLSITRGFSSAPNPQCNLRVFAADMPSEADMVAALNSVLGTPTNIADAVRPDGRPNRRYEPEWLLSSSNGSERVAFVVNILTANSYTPVSSVHLALIERPSKSVTAKK